MTPVLDARQSLADSGFLISEAEVPHRNAAALAVATNVTINDLYNVIVSLGVEQCIGGDGLHMTAEGNGVLAGAVEAATRGALGEA